MKNLKKNAGFTLVELIVVIAILGILAGVGTVAYTGYVDKAKEAADQQLLSAVNLAFASACIDSGVDMNNVSHGYVEVDNNKRVTGAEASGVSDLTAFSGDFMAYLGDEGTTFSKTKWLNFDNVKHVFTLGTGMDASMSLTQLGYAQSFVNSNYKDNPESLAKMTGGLSRTVSSILGGKTEGVAYLKTFLGEDEYTKFINDYGVDESNPTTAANAMVKYVAAKLSTIDTNEDNYTEDLDTLSAAALSLAQISAYANSSYATQDFKTKFESAELTNLESIDTLAKAMDDDGGGEDESKGFGAYEESGQSDTDRAAAINAMKIINEKQDEFDIADPDAFDSDATLALMRALINSAQGNS